MRRAKFFYFYLKPVCRVHKMCSVYMSCIFLFLPWLAYSPTDTVGDLKKLVAAQTGTRADKIVLKKWLACWLCCSWLVIIVSCSALSSVNAFSNVIVSVECMYECHVKCNLCCHCHKPCHEPCPLWIGQIKLLRSQGMPESKLHVIFVALIISRIVYALSALGGFLNSQQINRINAFLRKARRFGLCSSTCLCDVSEYLRLADCRLFNRIQSHSHCLSHLLPPEKHHLGLRPRGHRYTLLTCPNNLCKSSFIPQSLFCFLWFFHLQCLIYSVLYYCITLRLSFV